MPARTGMTVKVSLRAFFSTGCVFAFSASGTGTMCHKNSLLLSVLCFHKLLLFQVASQDLGCFVNALSIAAFWSGAWNQRRRLKPPNMMKKPKWATNSASTGPMAA